MLRKHLRIEIKSEINIIPLLDVLLVLLLIFMAMAPNITQSIEVNLPDAVNSKIITKDKDSLVIIEVSNIGEYSMITDHQRQNTLTAKQVIFKTRAHIAANPKTVFLIGGSKDSSYSKIITALNLLHQAGVKSVNLMTYPI